jgi:hypothetical protein
MAKTPAKGLMLKHASDAWAIFNVLKTLVAALPDDEADCEIPTRGVLCHAVRLSESLASTLMESTDD